MKRLLRIATVVICAAGTVAAAPPSRTAAEAATVRYFTSIRNNPPLLLAFLTEMPKGGDLHNHLSGAIYAENYLAWAAADGLCVTIARMAITDAPCDAAAGRPPATEVLRNTTLFNQVVDAMSMRHWDPSLNGHDHFFATFAKFGSTSSTRTDDMLAELAVRAAAEHVSYLELMVNTEGGMGAARGNAAGWDPDLPKLRDTLLAAGFRDAVVSAARARIDEVEAKVRGTLKCGTPQASPACLVTLRYIYQISRATSPQAVFGQMVAGFEIATADPRVVSLNLVQPEDDPNAVRDFRLQMSMLNYLHGVYPNVKLTMHAGELTDGLVPPETLRFHIRETIQVGHAQRIGHGVDVMFEDDPFALLREMAAKKVLVEIALTSNDMILGVKGARHPLRAYLKYGVPVALVTDDAGVSRSTLTLEYRKAVEEQGLDYPTLKRLARNSIAYSFADAATKARLARDLETAFTAFERRTANAERRTQNDERHRD